MSWATSASSCEIVDGLVAEFAAMVACVDARLASACWTESSCLWSACLSPVIVLLSCVQLFTEVVGADVEVTVVTVPEFVDGDVPLPDGELGVAVTVGHPAASSLLS